ncbi:MAG: O-methyltransferase [Melioribacter sp.]|uniref:O-methyltransferase n=1 Tax=Rosettibacter primus TaxID=3111523 RepID=UPI00247C1D59|nr:O-methyltransferase [Melioribacter sp.]
MNKIIYEKQIKYLESLRNVHDPIIKEMEEFAKANNIPILDWKAAEFLEQLILMLRPKRVLEIGTAIAYSSIRIARRLRKKAVLDTIEKSLDNISLAGKFIEKAGLESKINLIEGDALDILPSLTKKYDLIFLDADKQDYEKLFYYSLVLLKKHGVIFIDNLLWHGYVASNIVPASYKNSAKIIREFNKLFLNHNSLQSTILPIGDGIGLGVKL